MTDFRDPVAELGPHEFERVPIRCARCGGIIDSDKRAHVHQIKLRPTAGRSYTEEEREEAGCDGYSVQVFQTRKTEICPACAAEAVILFREFAERWLAWWDIKAGFDMNRIIHGEPE